MKDGPEATNVEELKARLACCYIARNIESAGLSLPPLTRQLVPVDLTDRELESYQSKLAELPLEEIVNAILHRRASARTLELLNQLRKRTSRGKITATAQLAAGIYDQEESAIVFCWERDVCERIASKLHTLNVDRSCVHIIHGGESHTVRNKRVNDFQAHGGVLVATIDSLGVGVTLHKARHVIMHDLDWVPSKMLQAEKRAHRIGQVWPVTSYWMTASGTIDGIVARAFEKKAQPIFDVTGDSAPSELAALLPREEVYAGIQRTLDWVGRIA